MNNYLFLLGGKDLEMVEIKKILKDKDLPFFDNHLSWGAKLSDYQKEIEGLDEDYTLVGIELLKDIELNFSYIEIDHHNCNSDKPSAIEQLADLLDFKLTRYQKLIAENDKGHIKAMEKFGANEEEIEEIRRQDRKAQGVSKEDEKLAKESIINNLEKKKGVIIVKSKTDKFSPICDRLYPADKIIIYNENELNYYGMKAEELGKKFQKEYGEKKVYFSGGEDGYFGFSAGVLKLDEMEKVIKEIINHVKRS